MRLGQGRASVALNHPDLVEENLPRRIVTVATHLEVEVGRIKRKGFFRGLVLERAILPNLEGAAHRYNFDVLDGYLPPGSVGLRPPLGIEAPLPPLPLQAHPPAWLFPRAPPPLTRPSASFASGGVSRT